MFDSCFIILKGPYHFGPSLAVGYRVFRIFTRNWWWCWCFLQWWCPQIWYSSFFGILLVHSWVWMASLLVWTVPCWFWTLPHTCLLPWIICCYTLHVHPVWWRAMCLVLWPLILGSGEGDSDQVPWMSWVFNNQLTGVVFHPFSQWRRRVTSIVTWMGKYTLFWGSPWCNNQVSLVLHVSKGYILQSRILGASFVK